MLLDNRGTESRAACQLLGFQFGIRGVPGHAITLRQAIRLSFRAMNSWFRGAGRYTDCWILPPVALFDVRRPEAGVDVLREHDTIKLMCAREDRGCPDCS